MNKLVKRLWKWTTAYVVGAVAFIQLASILLENLSSERVFGASSETVMQVIFIAILVALPIVMAAAYFFREQSANAPLESADITASGDYKQRLAVIPFANLNQDQDGGFLVDGIVEDVITEFSMVREIEILSRQTCFNLREKDLSNDKLRNEYGLDYVVSGSIRALDDRLRISVELAETVAGNVVWSNKYDRVKKDVFDIQDEIVRRITIALIGEIEISSLKRAHRKPTENITSYEFLLQGKNNHHKFTKHANEESRKNLDAAIIADSHNAQAYAWKACAIGQALGRGYLEPSEEVINSVGELLDTALALDPNDFECHRMFCEVHLSMHQFDQALKSGQKAYKMNPNDPRVISVFGEVLLRLGEIDEGLLYLEKAYQLEPIPAGQTTSDKRLAALFFGHYLKSDFAICQDLIERMANVDNRSWLLNIELHSRQSKNYLDLNWYKKVKNTFSELDWSVEIDRYHLNNGKLESKLLQLARSL